MKPDSYDEVIAQRDAALAEAERLRELLNIEEGKGWELRVQLRGEADARVGDIEQLSAEKAILEHDLSALRERHAATVEANAALRARHDEIVSVVADITRAYAADKQHHVEAVEQAFREGATFVRLGSITERWLASEAKARLI